MYTHACDKTTSNLAQGLEVSRFSMENQREIEETTMRSLGAPGSKFLNMYFLLTMFGVVLITTTTTIVNKFNNISTAIGFFIYGGLFIHLISFIFL